MVAPRCLVSKVTRHNMGPLGIQKIVKLNKIESSSIWSVVVDVVVVVVVVVVIVSMQRLVSLSGYVICRLFRLL